MTRKHLQLISCALDSYKRDLRTQKVLLGLRMHQNDLLGKEASIEYEDVEMRLAEAERLGDMVSDLLLRDYDGLRAFTK